jgi:hypothetical protein
MKKEPEIKVEQPVFTPCVRFDETWNVHDTSGKVVYVADTRTDATAWARETYSKVDVYRKDGTLR